MAALGKVTAEQLKQAQPDMPADVADVTAKHIRTLVGGPAELDERAYSDPAKQTLELVPAPEESDDADGKEIALSKRARGGERPDLEVDFEREDIRTDWEEIKAEVVETVNIVTHGTKRIVKAIIKTAKRVVELIVKTVTLVVKVLVQLLRLVVLGLKLLVDTIKYVVRWDQVTNTQ
ncbi:hypothetical protein HK102_001806, partial [Quaeritorhiza haematococci]